MYEENAPAGIDWLTTGIPSVGLGKRDTEFIFNRVTTIPIGYGVELVAPRDRIRLGWSHTGRGCGCGSCRGGCG